MPARIEIVPSGPVQAEVAPPGSKSLTNRALVCASLAEGVSLIRNASLSDDSRVLLRALQQLGFECTLREDRHEILVFGKSGRIPFTAGHFDLENAGTSFRFLTSLLCLGEGFYVVDGSERMRERPVAPLVDALRSLGATIRYTEQEGRPPLEIEARGLKGGSCRIQADASSQFVSAVLMAAPYALEPVDVHVAADAVSRPYIDMTLQVMKDFGVAAALAPPDLRVPKGRYQAREWTVEADAAAAGYFLALAAVTGGRTRVLGLGRSCVQPEFMLVGDLERMGCRVDLGADALELRAPKKRLRGIDVRMDDHPDSAQTLAVVALFAEGPTRLRGIRHLRFKETDRLAAMTRELGKLGARVTMHDDGLSIAPPASLAPALVETYGDHRMAMSFALAGAAAPGVQIEHPECVTKSFPAFWRTLEQAGVKTRSLA